MVLNHQTVIWHDLECGSYDADLPLWRELSQRHPEGPVLDVGAGTGRVTLAIAENGREVIALDRDPELLGALEQRAGKLNVRTVCADARSFQLHPRDELSLCLVPMQTIQLLGGPTQRLEFLGCVRAHLRPGGLLACAIVTALDPFDCTNGAPGPAPETVCIEETVYASLATRVQVLARHIVLERERHTIQAPGGLAGAPLDGYRLVAGGPGGERSVVALDRVSTTELGREAESAGLRLEGVRQIAATAEHTGSEVVMLSA